ncbi:hypothetical protein NDU88_004660 [Pleurodeles waltl]|uniref:Uncharacterized protein n=1 Tax=Pleurodeles waltl TaxID=8319 RepID=A0AAV7V1R3_PLEWA|nr:hypothetical protein NDU88_004660 [Pleurodeles waltl]
MYRSKMAQEEAFKGSASFFDRVNCPVPRCRREKLSTASSYTVTCGVAIFKRDNSCSTLYALRSRVRKFREERTGLGFRASARYLMILSPLRIKGADEQTCSSPAPKKSCAVLPEETIVSV